MHLYRDCISDRHQASGRRALMTQVPPHPFFGDRPPPTCLGYGVHDPSAARILPWLRSSPASRTPSEPAPCGSAASSSYCPVASGKAPGRWARRKQRLCSNVPLHNLPQKSGHTPTTVGPIHWLRARGFRQRLFGLHALPRLPLGCGLLLLRCQAIHTVGMRQPIDVVFIDAEGCITRCVPHLAPNRVAWCRRAHSTGELAAGAIGHFGLRPGMRVLTSPSRKGSS